ncbi:MAG TPA: type II toxin-antitoxin system PemK/MazF family toxin [Gaiellaceae bacterium]
MSLLHRGDVVALPPPRGARGHEQKGRRYGVVLQSTDLASLSTVVVAPTSARAQATDFRPAITVRGRKTRLLVEQLRTVDRERLAKPVAHLPVHELEDVEGALMILFGLF